MRCPPCDIFQSKPLLNDCNSPCTIRQSFDGLPGGNNSNWWEKLAGNWKSSPYSDQIPNTWLENGNTTYTYGTFYALPCRTVWFLSTSPMYGAWFKLMKDKWPSFLTLHELGRSGTHCCIMVGMGEHCTLLHIQKRTGFCIWFQQIFGGGF